MIKKSKILKIGSQKLKKEKKRKFPIQLITKHVIIFPSAPR